MFKQPAQGAKPAISENSKIKTIVKGIIVSYIITIPAFLVFALILSYTDFPEKYVKAVVMITTVLSILVAGITTTKHVENRGWLNGCIVGFIYIAVLYLASSVVFRDFSISRHTISMVLIGILAGAIGGIFGINMRRDMNYKNKRQRYMGD